jgi:Domain of Unknown Function (DUF1080)
MQKRLKRLKGWKSLIDSTTTNGWVGLTKTGLAEALTNWKAENGSLVRPVDENDTVYAPEHFGNFVLSLDGKVADKGIGGVFIRLSDLKDSINTGAETQVLDINQENENVGISKSNRYRKRHARLSYQRLPLNGRRLCCPRNL